jgi:ATP-binding cassette, subfamily B, bacterial MsbA
MDLAAEASDNVGMNKDRTRPGTSGPLSEAGEHRTWPLLRRLLKEHIRQHWPRLGAALLCMSVVATATAGTAWLMQPMLDKVFIAHDTRLLYLIPAGLVVLSVLKGFASYGQVVLMTTVGQRIVAEIQQRLFARLMGADLAYFQRNSTGSLVSRFINDCTMLRHSTATLMASLGKEAVTAVFLVALMFFQDWVLALIAIAAFPLAIRPLARIGKRMRTVAIDTQVEIGEFTAFLDQVFQGARHVKAYGMETYEEQRANTVIKRIYRLVRRSRQVSAISSPLMETLGGIAVGAVILYGGHQVIDGVRTPGAFFSFITALLMAYQPLKASARFGTSLQEGLAAAQRIFGVLDLEPEIRDRTDARPLAIRRGEIEFDDVTFEYGNGARALHGIDLVVPAGKTVALVGPSGAGKSTILNLIPRFFDVTSGAVRIDGTDIRHATLSSVRGALALVTQEISLFDDTVRSNIAYGRSGASNADIVAAATAAAADDFIRALPQGYDTIVGEHGIKLSGGQRQRIAIARAMLKNAPILLLDEATSALDTESERQVQAALYRLMEGRTTLVIAHRFSTVIDADLIYVVDQGRIVERGTHTELLRLGGAYARLYAMQFADDASPVAPRIDEPGTPVMQTARA